MVKLINKLAPFLVAFVLMAPGVLRADDDAAERADIGRDFYSGFRVSVTNMRLSSDSGKYGTNTYPTGMGLIVGYRFNKYSRMDLEVDYMNAENRAGTTRMITNSQMVNIYWSTAPREGLAPSLYAGFGMGTSNLDLEYRDPGRGGWAEGNFKLSYQFATGLDIYLNKYLGVDIGVRWRHFGEVMHQTDAGRQFTDVSAFQLYAGMKLKY
jgi:opacity protein-like surface antigen